MVTTAEQYEAFPYPARDPADERKRLVTGTPSLPWEIDHFLHGGRRDWSRPLRVLVAGGGTGDGTIQLAQLLTDAGKRYEITYLDLSTASRAIAEERARVRGLRHITFHTGSLLDAAEFGRFDYIDCCGVLHHLPDPAAGFRALRAALAEGGGMGLMVYAPHGRSGVYPLQAAFGALFEGLPPAERVSRARQIVARLPKGHPFRVNPRLTDHEDGDAGFYDLLLHGQDRPYAVPELLAVLEETGWRLQSFAHPALYDLSRYCEVPDGMDAATQWATAERLAGTIKTHVAYVTAADDPRPLPDAGDLRLIPRLGADPRKLAARVQAGQGLPLRLADLEHVVKLPKAAARLLAGADGRTPLMQMGKAAGLSPPDTKALWARVDAALRPWGALHYTTLGAS